MIASVVTRLNAGVTDPAEYLNVLKLFVVQERYCTIWFLTCLFLLYQGFYLLVYLVKDKQVMIAVFSVAIGAFGLVYYRCGGSELPWNADVCLTAFPFFSAGYLSSQNASFFRQKMDVMKNKYLVPMLILGTAVLYLVSVTLNVKISGTVLNFATNKYGFIPLTLLSVLTGIICTCIVSSRVPLHIPAYLGKHTWVYFSWHQSIVLPILLYVYKLGGVFQEKAITVSAVRTIVTVLLMFALLYPFDLLFSKTRLRCLIGE